MKCKVAVIDACIFIDLHDLGLTNSFFKLNLDIHSTSSVMFELYIEQRQILETYQSVKKLTIHNLQENDFIEISSENYPKSLSETDKSVLFIVNKMNACVLSSDKIIRNFAKNKGIECHGMIWLFDKFVEAGFLTGKEASRKLNQLVATNFVFRNNQQLVDEIEKRLKLWG
jgi:rRNA-processing protein FCF1